MASEPKVLSLRSKAPTALLSEIPELAGKTVTVSDVWHYCLVYYLPLRTIAAGVGLVLAEPTIGDWSECFYRCFVCGKREPMNPGELSRLQTHHVERKSQSHKSRYNHPVNYLRCCLACHEGPLATMAHARQLAYKWRSDLAGYGSLADFVTAFLRVKDPELRAPHRVTVEEVLEALEKIQSKPIGHAAKRR